MKILYDIEVLKRTCGVYQIRNIVNGKVYIGSTGNFWKRYDQHIKKLIKSKHCNPHLQHSFNKHKINSFVFEPLKVIFDDTTILELRKLEQACIDDVLLNNGKQFCFNSRKQVDTEKNKTIKQQNKLKNKKNYNLEFINPNNGEIVLLTDNISEFCRKNNIRNNGISAVIAGTRNHVSGWKLRFPIRVEKTKSEILKERWESDEEYRNKMAITGQRPMKQNVKDALLKVLKGNKHNKGKKLSEKTRKKMSDSAKGKIISESQRKGQSDRMKGRKISIEHKKKLISALIGRIPSAKQRQSVSKANEKFYDVILISPDGILYGPFVNLAKFCIEHSLLSNKMSLVITGRQKSHKGWELYSNNSIPS